MDGPLGVNAERGTQHLLAEAGQLLEQALAVKGAGAAITCLNTVYYLPVALGLLAKPVQRMGDLQAILEHASMTPERGRAALLAAEILEALRATAGHFISPVSDSQIHAWGMQLADGRMPGIALLLGRATSPASACELVEELRRRNILCLLGSGLQAQLAESGRASACGNRVIALGEHDSSAVHAVGVAARCAMKLGAHMPGAADEILEYCQVRLSGFVLALGGLHEQDYAIARGAEEFGFPLIESQGGAESARELADRCIAMRGLKPKVFNVHIPVDYGPAFEDQAVPVEDLHIQFGGADCASFVLLETAPADAVADGRIDVIGPELPNRPQRAGAQLGIVVKVSGTKLTGDHEPYLEKQLPAYINYADGIECSLLGNEVLVRFSKDAVAGGLDLESIGRILYGRLHGEFPAAIEKVQVSLITDAVEHAKWLEIARGAHKSRRQRMASLTDDQVDVFYACMNCRPIAPRNVSIISPERVSPCGQRTWLDAKAAYELSATSAHKPIPLGNPVDPEKGIWEGTNQYAKAASRGRIQQVSLYSIMETPMAACADFECMVVVIPEANGVMVLGRDDTLLATPAGLTVETFTSLAAGEQIPGIAGMGRSHLVSAKFLAPEGGFRRVVWMSSALKEALGDELRAVCAREGDPDLLSKIADERDVTTVEELVRWLQQHDHPARTMQRLF